MNIEVTQQEAVDILSALAAASHVANKEIRSMKPCNAKLTLIAEATRYDDLLGRLFTQINNSSTKQLFVQIREAKKQEQEINHAAS